MSLAPRPLRPAPPSGRIANLTVIILTFNEERHIERCIASLRGVASRVVVVDSHSTDRTCELACALGAEVLQNPWVNHATQFNWALDQAGITTTWVMRLDADEVLDEALSDWLSQSLDRVAPDVAGLTVNRQIHFLGRWIRHGDIYPRRLVRLWRTGSGRCEQRWMDEHIEVLGNVIHVDHDIADINLNNLTWWIGKHNHYATLEAMQVMLSRHQAAPSAGNKHAGAIGMQARMNRFFKDRVYAKTPIAIRALLYFVYRYFFRLGFLDGWQGLIYHSLQGLWYRFLIDVKIWEIEQLMNTRSAALATIIKTEYGFDVDPYSTAANNSPH
jgi:glycosyltransferase involved in cell wall biosynthesis